MWNFKKTLLKYFRTACALSLLVCGATAVAIAAKADSHKAQAAAESGLEFAQALIESYTPPASAVTAQNLVTQAEGLETFGHLYHHLLNELDGQDIAYDQTHATLRIPAKGTIRSSAHTDMRFFLEFSFAPAKKPTDHHLLVIVSTGSADNTEHQSQLTFPIRKDAKILDYAIASRPRVWITGDTTIDNTDRYLEGLEDLPDSDVIATEYFSHAPGDYTAPKYPTSLKLQRHLYRDKVFSNRRLPEDRNALFINCTFNNTFYIDVYKSGDIKYNNVRFDNCTFNGTLVTDVPQQFKWQKNVLTFTGRTLFQNKDHKATILAPHFNVNLGDIDPTEPEKQNQTNGVIIGGIVDIRGNAQVNGTIISMADTTRYSDGYVTNIGATLNDGGAETTEPLTLGTIVMTPKPGGLLPNGIKSPIIIGPANSKELAYVKL